jgi:hypothetical protein
MPRIADSVEVRDKCPVKGAATSNAQIAAALAQYGEKITEPSLEIANLVNGIDADSSLSLDRTLGLTNTTADA